MKVNLGKDTVFVSSFLSPKTQNWPVDAIDTPAYSEGLHSKTKKTTLSPVASQ